MWDDKIIEFGLVWLVGWLAGFYSISTFVGHSTPNPFYINNQFYLKQFSLAWTYRLIVKNISILKYSASSNSHI